MADFIFAITGAAFAALIAANLVLIIARFTHNERLARAVVRLSSHVTWFLKIGSDMGRRNNGVDGPSRV